MTSVTITPTSASTEQPVACIRIEQARLLYAQAPLGTLISLLVAPTLALILWGVMSHTVLLAWLALLEATLAVRFGLIVHFERQARRMPALDTLNKQATAVPWAERWIARYTWACTASGIAWGGCTLFLALSPSLVYDTFIALVLGGVLMGGVLTMTPVLFTYFAYALPLALPTILWLLLQDDPLHVAMGATGLLYLLLALGTAQRHHDTILRSLRLAMENLGLAHSFAHAKEQVEESNRRLAEQQAAMRDSVEAIRELYRVVSTPCRHPSDQIQALLAMGCRRFGLAIGILAHIEGERYEIIQVLSPGGEIAQGDIFNLDDTYCRETLRTQGPLGIEHTATSHWHSHPCYRKFRLEAYFGVPVRVGTTSYGTLNFSDFRPRPTPFTTVDRELIQLMAEWVGGALEQERMATAAQRQQALLAHASRLNTLGEMASGLVHEINQPVTAITLYTEACLARLRRGDIDPEETRDLIEKIASQSARANAIIQHIRRFARQGKPQYTINPVGEMLTEISDFLELETRRHGVRIGYDIAPDLPAALADRLQVQQVVCNLVRNAVDATAASTSLRLVTILARAAEAQIEIAVCDSGPGLKPEEMEQLMHPFFTTKPEGLGLGLPISQSIVEAHGGRLWATVNLDSPGMTFHFTLPVAGSAEPRTQRPVHALESNRAGRV